MGYQKPDIQSIIWRNIKNIRTVLLFLMQNQILNTFTAFTRLPFFSIVRKGTILIDRLGDPYVDNHQFLCVPRSPHQNFDCVNETVHFSAFTVFDTKLLMSLLLTVLAFIFILEVRK